MGTDRIVWFCNPKPVFHERPQMAELRRPWGSLVLADSGVVLQCGNEVLDSLAHIATNSTSVFRERCQNLLPSPEKLQVSAQFVPFSSPARFEFPLDDPKRKELPVAVRAQNTALPDVLLLDLKCDLLLFAGEDSLLAALATRVRDVIVAVLAGLIRVGLFAGFGPLLFVDFNAHRDTEVKLNRCVNVRSRESQIPLLVDQTRQLTRELPLASGR